MRTSKPVTKKSVSLLTVAITIVVALAIVGAIGFYSLRPHPGIRTKGGGGGDKVIRQRLAVAKRWQKELDDAKREGRQPDPSLEPVFGQGRAGTVGSRGMGRGPASMPMNMPSGR
jgi:hypothetical protein